MEFKGERRKYPGLIQKYEKRVLVKFAKKVPKFLSPDHFTLLALVSALAISLCYYFGPKFPYLYLLAAVLWFFHWLFDSLDGTLARVRHQERPRYGFYIDHLIDCISVSVIGIGFASSGISNPLIWMVFTVLILLFFIHQFLRVSVGEHFILGISFSKIGSTEARVLASIASILLYFFASFGLLTFPSSLIDQIGLGALILTGIVFVIESFFTTFTLKKKDESRLKQKNKNR